MQDNFTARNILIHLACVHNGDWEAIRRDLLKKSLDISDSDLELAAEIDAITIADADLYPRELMSVPQAPFVLFREAYPINSDSSSRYELTSDFKALACIQEITDGCWDYNERAAHKAVVEHFASSPTITITDQAEILIKQGAKKAAYREWFNHKRFDSFFKASIIASALCKYLFVFHVHERGMTMRLVNAMSGTSKIYVLPHQWVCGDDLCNTWLTIPGFVPLTPDTLAAIKTGEQ